MVNESILRVLSVFRYTKAVHGFSELKNRAGLTDPSLSRALDALSNLGVITIASDGQKRTYIIVNQDIAWLSDLLLRTVFGGRFEALVSMWSREEMIRVIDIPMYVAMLVYRLLDGLLMPGVTGAALFGLETRVPTSLVFDVVARRAAELTHEVYKAIESMKKAEVEEKLFGKARERREGQSLEKWSRKGKGSFSRYSKFSE